MKLSITQYNLSKREEGVSKWCEQRFYDTCKVHSPLKTKAASTFISYMRNRFSNYGNCDISAYIHNQISDKKGYNTFSDFSNIFDHYNEISDSYEVLGIVTQPYTSNIDVENIFWLEKIEMEQPYSDHSYAYFIPYKWYKNANEKKVEKLKLATYTDIYLKNYANIHNNLVGV